MIRCLTTCCGALFLIVPTPTLNAKVAGDSLTSKYERSVSGAIAFLRKSQGQDGSFSPEAGPGVTSLVTTALLRHGIPERDPVVGRALQYIDSFVQDDGGIYRDDSLYKNYETCLAILCFSEVEGERYQTVLQRAQAFVKGIQWDEGEGHDPSSTSYGGAGYGKHKRPDLSNTTFLIDALRASGVAEDDEALQRALMFVSRCQNLESQYNTTPFSTKNPDGGFYYTCAAGGSSQAGETATGGLRSYGSMTYAGLKSMIYAGVTADDPRVEAALAWIRQNYSLAENPGMKDAGLYYYYHTFAKSLAALDVDAITDQHGHEHSWQVELLDTLSAQQLSNGSWVNGNPRWLEGDAQLVTAYALMALSYLDLADQGL